MELAEKEKRFNWLKSQQKWHEQRGGKWHKSQARFYGKAAGGVFSFAEIVTRTLMRNKDAIAKAITSNNALLDRLYVWSA